MQQNSTFYTADNEMKSNTLHDELYKIPNVWEMKPLDVSVML